MRTSAFFLSVVLLGLGTAAFFFFRSTHPACLDVVCERSRLTAEIEARGPAAAYEEFKRAYAARDADIQHFASHLFGEVLYQAAGIEAIAVCDATFAFGCYHSFFAAAIGAEGIGIMPRLGEACIENLGEEATGCQHGIGHGVLEHLGYNNLLAALEACERHAPQTRPFSGCTSGVFMEYNVPLVVSPDAAYTVIRPFDQDDPYDPCPGLPARFRESCYHESGQWWKEYISYQEIGGLCAALADQKERRACFHGVGGSAAPSSGREVAATPDRCAMMPTAEGKSICQAAVVTGAKPKEGPPAILNPVEERRFWERRVETSGAEAAYREFKEAYQARRFDVQHLASHLFGEVLYRAVGLAGISVCDESFAFGCYHSFFGQAFAKRGLEVVPELDQACIAKYGLRDSGCQHGIGHGLMEYLGHDTILAALSACEKTTQPHPLHGCTSGVFMEYNIATLISPDDVKSVMRTPNAKNLYEPCDAIVPPKFRPSCYHEISLWWKHAVSGDFDALGRLCGGIASEEERDACFLGLGNVIASSEDYDPTAARRACADMPRSRGEAFCLFGAALRFFGTDMHQEAAPELCRLLPADLRAKCLPKE